MSSKIILYGSHTSPAVRAVKMTMAALELDYEFKFIDTYAGETKTPEFIKKNPQHTVPTLEETDGKCLWDSHAIMAYLVRRYGKNDELYPKGFYERAVVDQRLHYENGVIFENSIRHQLGPFLRGEVGKDKLPEVLKKFDEIYELLEIFIGDNEYVAGKSLTIADFSVVASLATLAIMKPIEADQFPKLATWFGKMKKLPYYEQANAEGLKQLNEKIQARLTQEA